MPSCLNEHAYRTDCVPSQGREQSKIAGLGCFVMLAVMGLPASCEAQPATSRGDLVCGPRCVQYVLAHYGRDADLMSLVREMQWPHLEAGSSVGSVERALSDRGIEVASIADIAAKDLTWPTPVIVHLRDVTNHQVGHFAVLLQNDGKNVRLWMGMEGVVELSLSGLRERFSGVAVLTALTPIDKQAWQSRFARQQPIKLAAGICLAAATASMLVSVFRHRRRSGIIRTDWLRRFLVSVRCLSRVDSHR